MQNKNVGSPKQSIIVWDIFIRIFHWSLVFLVLVSFVTEDDYLTIHSYSGYAILSLISLRIIWGFIGTKYARFSNFIASPKVALKYLKEEISGDAKRYIGHNPAGAIMIVSLIITFILTAFTGMATIATDGKGPLASTFIANFSEDVLGEIHELLTGVLLTLIILHILGVIFSSLAEEENLVKAMFTGKKEQRNYQEKSKD